MSYNKKKTNQFPHITGPITFAPNPHLSLFVACFSSQISNFTNKRNWSPCSFSLAATFVKICQTLKLLI